MTNLAEYLGHLLQLGVHEAASFVSAGARVHTTVSPPGSYPTSPQPLLTSIGMVLQGGRVSPDAPHCSCLS